MEELVSVITLTYRNINFLYKTIDSVLNQNYPLIEYIISDDGTVDFPQDQIEKYIHDNRRENLVDYKIMHSEKNRGTVKNINTAYSVATGDYIFPLSCGDFFYSTETVSKIIAAFNRKQCNLLVTRRVACDANGSELYMIPNDNEVKRIKRLSSNRKQYNAFVTDEFYNMASGSVLYLRKSYYEKMGGFDENYDLWEDDPFLTKYSYSHYVDNEYSIISIKYALGGVSNGNSITSSRMKRDMLLYDKTTRREHWKELGYSLRRKIDYIEKNHRQSGFKYKLRLCITYPDVVISRLLYKIKSCN